MLLKILKSVKKSKNCALSEYLQAFISNGYESLEKIKQIDNKNILLHEIEIVRIEHRSKIWNEIQKLNTNQTNGISVSQNDFGASDDALINDKENDIIIMGDDEVTPKQ